MKLNKLVSPSRRFHPNARRHWCEGLGMWRKREGEKNFSCLLLWRLANVSDFLASPFLSSFSFSIKRHSRSFGAEQENGVEKAPRNRMRSRWVGMKGGKEEGKRPNLMDSPSFSRAFLFRLWSVKLSFASHSMNVCFDISSMTKNRSDSTLLSHARCHLQHRFVAMTEKAERDANSWIFRKGKRDDGNGKIDGKSSFLWSFSMKFEGKLSWVAKGESFFNSISI